MPYSAKNYSHLIGLPGFSDTLLNNHFTLYEGYVKNTNALSDKLKALSEKGEFSTPEFAEFKRRFGWEWNGMRLHELYFGNMTKESTLLSDGTLQKGLIATYGSVEDWKKNFVGTGSMRGIGWVILVHDAETGKLSNVWVNEHDLGHLVGTTPLLVMDVFEHAFMIDYGLKRADYIEAFFRSIDWKIVEQRLKEHQS
ncbi:MAG: Fe-Mn family superoxide dismutase [Candidatus Moraniibacteriota bacterium]